MPHLLVAGRMHPAGEARMDTLRDDGVEVTYVPEISEDSYLPHLPQADALVLRTQPLRADAIARAPRLRVVSRHGVGYDAVDVAALNARGIALTIVGDVNSTSVAEQAMMQLLAGAKQAMRADRAVRDPSRWEWRNRMEQREISGANLLIVGYGRAGRKLARMARGFDMQLRAYDPFLLQRGWPDDDVTPVSTLAEGLAWADCLSLHLPKGAGPLLGPGEFATMKPGMILANTARGGIVDEAALCAALEAGQVFAAGLDVFETEPPAPGMALAGRDDVILSPHIAGLTAEAGKRMALAAIDNALGYLDGSIDTDLIVNRDALG